MTLLSIVVFVFIFSLLILIHEWGHFAAARKSGVQVDEFGIGLPPRIWGVKKGETLYSINAIPFGGFVRMLGEDGSAKAKKNKRSFFNQSLGKQAFIVSAGVVMNLLLAWVLLTGGFIFGMEPLIATTDDFLAAIREDVVHVEIGTAAEDERIYVPRLVFTDQVEGAWGEYVTKGEVLLNVENSVVLQYEDLEEILLEKETVDIEVYSSVTGIRVEKEVPVPNDFSGFKEVGVVITSIEEGSPADNFGLELGDQLIEMNGKELRSANDVVELTKINDGEITYGLLRDERVLEINIYPRDDGRVGMVISDLFATDGIAEDLYFYTDGIEHQFLGIEVQKYGWQSPIVALQEMWRLGKLTAVTFVEVLGKFLLGKGVPDGVAGPVGIAELTALSVQEGFSSVIRLVALLSLSLGVLNILPLPALDGGRLFFIIVQVITGKKPSPRIEHLVHTAGLFLLLAFITYITFNDVLNLL